MALDWEGLPKAFNMSASHDTKTLSPLRWCRESLIRSVTAAVFGDRLLQLEPRLVDIFRNFDDNSWQLTDELPRSLAKEAHAAKDKILATFEQYFGLPRDQRAGETWLVRTLETEMRKIEVSELILQPSSQCLSGCRSHIQSHDVNQTTHFPRSIFPFPG